MAKTTLDYLKSLIAMDRPPQAGAEEEVSRRPFVTISRQAGAGGITLGEKLSAELQASDTDAAGRWLRFDRDLVDKVVEDHHLPSELAERMSEAAHSQWRMLIEDLISDYPSWTTLVRKTSDTIRHLAEMGDVILVGRGSNIVTRDLPGGLHIRLVGSRERRVEHVQEYYKLGREEAEALIKREDKDRARYIKDYFGEDIDDPRLYDITFNSDHLPQEGIVAMIRDQVLRLRAAATAQ